MNSLTHTTSRVLPTKHSNLYSPGLRHPSTILIGALKLTDLSFTDSIGALKVRESFIHAFIHQLCCWDLYPLGPSAQLPSCILSNNLVALSIQILPLSHSCNQFQRRHSRLNSVARINLNARKKIFSTSLQYEREQPARYVECYHVYSLGTSLLLVRRMYSI
jgi:hypothetical protein